MPECDFADLGFALVDDPQEGGRPHIQQIEKDSTASTLRIGRKTLRHHCLVAVNAEQACNSEQAIELLAAAVNSNDYPITLSIAPIQKQQPIPPALEGFPLLHFDQLRQVSEVREGTSTPKLHCVVESREGMQFDKQGNPIPPPGEGTYEPVDQTHPPPPIRHPTVVGWYDPPREDEYLVGMSTSGDMDMCLSSLREVDQTLLDCKLSRKRLRVRTDWPRWQSSEWDQLDKHWQCGLYGHPVHRHTLPVGALIIHAVWTYIVQKCGEYKARNCCNGAQLKARGVEFARTYAACVEQHSFRLFICLSALLGHLCMHADATNAYAQAPPPSTPTYVAVDSQFQDWHMERFGAWLTRDMVAPVLGALQGHPEAGASWDGMVNDKKLKPQGFRSPVHERCLYAASIVNKKTNKPEKTLLCRQVDDYAMSAPDSTVPNQVVDYFNDETDPIPTRNYGLLKHCNGVDVLQTTTLH